MSMYQINKGINKPIEFKGLKAQYIGYLAGGLVILLIGFAIMYLIGVPVYWCIIIVAGLGCALFYQVFRLSHKYGEHGLMKKAAKHYLPNHLKFSSRRIFLRLKQ
ncbi:DUF4133 domain-containing protein [Mucilaginibacter puniceus]